MHSKTVAPGDHWQSAGDYWLTSHRKQERLSYRRITWLIGPVDEDGPSRSDRPVPSFESGSRTAATEHMKTDRNQILTWVMAIVIVALFVAVVYVSATPQQGADSYTEFYVLNAEGSASGYPTNVLVGETSTLIIGVSNQEHTTMLYTLAVVLDNETIITRTVRINKNETWEERVSFTPESAGRSELRMLLYKGEDANVSEDAYRSLRLWVDVSR